ncbi:pancreatic lipase-related protein 2 isoform X2 [Hyalella azteca]|uniref:Pancreatic lipase-related protein 2 isoform X2 n=1 Tax=Hyalella azteca TaxID=294128 RepID=A0A979FHI9_HYAAZ|nr:pancreatic lipase-related protein 2 isoform X2 [Hyalella azteca]
MARKLVCFLLVQIVMTTSATANASEVTLPGYVVTRNRSTSNIYCQSNETAFCYSIYGELEDFSPTAPWSHRIPFTPAQLGTEFWLISRPNQRPTMILDLNNKTALNNASMNLYGKVYILVHGWHFGSSSSENWTERLTSELMSADSSNDVVEVKWTKGARGFYPQAVANVRVVARQLAFFINSLQVVQNISGHSFHLIGHSLGAHVCGIAGTFLQQRYGITIERITGLDPAQPGFKTEESLTRLDQSDASFVDVIHTDTDNYYGIPINLGMKDPIGHLDFYPNGGGPQPGCLGERPGCSHSRAHELFIESVRQECSFVAVRCSTKEMFFKGECWGCKAPHECSDMGLMAVPTEVPVNSKFLLLTRGSSPYCDYHYLVSITLGNINGWEIKLRSLAIIGSSGTSDYIGLTSAPEYSTAGSVHRYVVLARSLGQLRLVTVSLTYRRLSASDVSMGLRESRLFLSKVSVQMLGSESLTEFCFNGSSGERNVQHVTLTADEICSSTTETVLPPATTTGLAATPLPLVGAATAPVTTSSSVPQAGAATIGVAPTAGAVGTKS